MKLTKNSIYWMMTLIFIEVIILWILLLLKLSKAVVSNIFFGVSTVLMLGYLIQYFRFKAINFNVRHNKLKINQRDKELVGIYLKDKHVKPDSHSNYSHQTIIDARRRQGWVFVLAITPAIIISVTITLIIAL